MAHTSCKFESIEALTSRCLSCKLPVDSSAMAMSMPIPNTSKVALAGPFHAACLTGIEERRMMRSVKTHYPEHFAQAIERDYHYGKRSTNGWDKARREHPFNSGGNSSCNTCGGGRFDRLHSIQVN